MTKQERGKEGQFVAVLDKAFRILNSFTEQDIWLSSTEIATIAKIPKPTASRLAKALTAMDYLHYSRRRRKYRLGIAVLSLGYAGRAESGVTSVIRPYLQMLADHYGVHASLAMRDGTDMVQLIVAHSKRTLMTLQLEVGSRIPIAGTATGHALLGALGDKERKSLLESLSRRHYKQWGKLRREVMEGVKEVQQLGFTSSHHGWQTDINGVAVPLIVPGIEILILSCGAPARHLPRAKMDDIATRLLEITSKVSAELGGKQKNSKITV